MCTFYFSLFIDCNFPALSAAIFHKLIELKNMLSTLYGTSPVLLSFRHMGGSVKNGCS